MKKFISLLLLLNTTIFVMSQTAEDKLKELKIELPVISTPMANYVHVVEQVIFYF